MTQFLMPSLGSDMEAGKLVEQSIAAGAEFHRGDVIGAVETQKGVIEVEVFEDGVLDHWLVDIGTTVPVGMPLVELRSSGDPTPEIPPEKDLPPAPIPPEIPSEPEPVSIPPDYPPEPEPEPVPDPAPPEFSQKQASGETLNRAQITPAARRLACELGIDLAELPQPPGQIIRRQDILTLQDHENARPDASPPDPAADMRRAIAAAMTRSKQEIPHYYLSHQLDLTTADAFLTAQNAGRAPQDRLLMGAVYARAIARALVKYPEFNGHFGPDGFRAATQVNLGFAIHIRSGGLVAPALFDVANKNLDEVMHALGDLVTRVRAGRFRARELSDATLTLTSLGDRGVDQVVGVIYPPQVAIIGIGTPRLLPSVQDGNITARLSTTLTLAADHRVSDGHRGALFLRAIDNNLQEPDAL